MKVLLIIVAMLILLVISSGVAVAAVADGVEPHGPAPNSGDCIPDGSGF